ncbi:insulinase family protein [bacterium]|nr:insulinase family protein [bacterium]
MFKQVSVSLFLLSAVFLLGCQPLDVISSDSITKSPNDKRDYQYLELSNQLKVLLISDPTTDKSAASLDVYVGSGDDPEDFQGLAHFLEHMLFLGTSKYPEPGEYQAYISDHGGSHNAYTSFEHTNYFFDIDPTYFGGGIDRFSQFFISPLFNEVYVDRERNAVYSEYTSKINSEPRRSLDVFKQVVNPDHPMSKFSVGNLDTLSDRGQPGSLQAELVKFYKKYYSASTMTLVVLDKASLSEQEAMVRKLFNGVLNNAREKKSIKTPLFEENKLPAFVEVKPLQKVRTLTLSFPVDDDVGYYQDKPLNYIGNIIGHEGSGSLLAYLKGQGWADGLSAGKGFSYFGGATFNVSVQLTEDGLQQQNEIITAVFETVNRIKAAKDQQWLFDEQQQIASQHFRFQEAASPQSYVRALSSDLHYYPVNELLEAPYMMRAYRPSVINGYLDKLRPDNVLVTLVSPQANVNKVSPYYNTDYSVKAINDNMLKLWRDAGVSNKILLPKPNPFIATNTLVKPIAKQVNKPELIVSTSAVNLWYLQDSKFNLPKGGISVRYSSPIASDTAQHSAYLKLWTHLVSDKLNELSYPAYLSGLGYGLNSHLKGFTLNINGFDDKQDVLLARVLDEIASSDFEQQRFNIIKAEIIRGLENTANKQPYKRLIDDLSYLLYETSWSDEELLEVYKVAELKDINAYKKQMLSEGGLDVLVYGNYTQEQAMGFSKSIENTLINTIAPKSEVGVNQLSGEYRSLVKSIYNDSSVSLYIQAEKVGMFERAAMGLTAQIVAADFYTQLRTEKQLGYIVMAAAYPVIDLSGLVFIVQSPTVSADALQGEISQYLHAQKNKNTVLTEREFERYKQALIGRLKEEPKNLVSQHDRYWQDIARSYVDFDLYEQLIVSLETLTLLQWREFYEQTFLSAQRKALWNYTEGEFAREPASIGESIMSKAKFKQGASYIRF